MSTATFWNSSICPFIVSFQEVKTSLMYLLSSSLLSASSWAFFGSFTPVAPKIPVVPVPVLPVPVVPVVVNGWGPVVVPVAPMPAVAGFGFWLNKLPAPVGLLAGFVVAVVEGFVAEAGFGVPVAPLIKPVVGLGPLPNMPA